MNRRFRKAVSMAALFAAAAVAPGMASAAAPGSVVGSWSTLVDQSYTTIDITNQGAPGAPGASQCRVIIGSIGVAPIRGFYCPGNGRIHFLHNNPSTNATVRTFTGVVSEDGSGSMHMAGSFNVMIHALADLGEYPFSANK